VRRKRDAPAFERKCDLRVAGLEVEDDAVAPFEHRLDIELAQPAQLIEAVGADRPARGHEFLAAAACDRLATESFLQKPQQLERQLLTVGDASPIAALLSRRLLERGADRVQPGVDVDADSEMKRVRV
jgi:hypothetical protein